MKFGAGIPFDPYLAMNAPVLVGPNWALGERREAALHSVLANALLAHWRGTSCFYPRDHNAFSNIDAPAWFTRSVLVPVIDRLAAERFLASKKTAPHPEASIRSSFSVLQKLEHLTHSTGVTDMVSKQGAAVLVRDRKTHKLLKSSGWAEELNVLVRDVLEQNELLQSLYVDLPKGKYPRDRGLLLAGNEMVVPLRQTMQRIFADTLKLGGRWYGGWWQNIPKRARGDLLINGEPVVEHDYSACQLRLMYGLLGLPDPLAGAIRRDDLDLFARAGEDRSAMKLAVMIGINATNYGTAIAALAEKLADEQLAARSQAVREAKRMFALVQKYFPELQPLWFTDIGIQLQRLDSDVCALVQRLLRRRGIAVLSVHDSFICRRAEEGRLVEAMLEGLAVGLRQAGNMGIAM